MIRAVLLISAGAFFGAIGRYYLGKWFNKGGFPLGTLFVNLPGAFLLGWLWGSGAAEPYQLLFGTGFLGALTTFSTLKIEMFNLIKQNRSVLLAYTAVTYIGGLLLAWLGYVCGR